METDGSVVIGTELSTDKFDRQIAELDSKIQKEEQKKLVIETKMQTQEQDLQEAISKTDELANAYQKLSAFKEKALAGKMTPGDFEAMQALQNQYGTLEKIDGLFQKALSKQDAIQLKIEQTKNQYDDINRKVQIYKSKIEGIKLQKHQADVQKIGNGFDSLGSKIQNVVKKVGKLILGIFGIRSAYMLLMRASSNLAGYDEQYATNLEYIKYVLTQAIAPVLKWIVELIARILGYVNAFWKALFGVNLFASGSAESFAKMKSNAQGVSKSVKEIKKQLTGFDEINMLTEQSDTGTSAGMGNNYTAPTISFDNVELPDWMKKIVDWLKPIVEWFDKIKEKYGPVKAGIIAVVVALAGFLILATIINLIKRLGNTTKSASTDFSKFFTKLGTALEVIAIFGGLALVINQVTKLIETFSESGLSLAEVGQLLAIVFGLVVAAFLAIVAASKLMDWKAVAGIAVTLGGIALVLREITKLLKTLSETGMDASDMLETFGTVVGIVIVLMASMVALAYILGSDPLALVGMLAIVASLVIILKTMSEYIPIILKALGDFIEQVAPPLIEIIKAIASAIEKIISAIKDALVPVVKEIGEVFDKYFGGIKDIIKQVGETFKTMAETVIWFFNEIGPAIERSTLSIIQSITKIVNFVISAIEFMLQNVLDGINEVADGARQIGLNFNLPRVVSLKRFQPQLKTGGIINMPNKGTLVGGGSAIAGEAGKEGVLPLTDQQAMAELGREIGKNVLVNLTNIMQMNGRVISREMKQVTDTRDFAYNL